MADRIFPTNVNEDPIDSEMVFQGINWDTFNERLAEVKEAGKKKKPIPPQFLEQIEKNRAKKAESGDDDNHKAGDNPGIENLVKNLKPEDKEVVKKVVCTTKTCKQDAECDECGCCDDCCECGEKDKKPNHVKKTKKASVTFTHPSQLSAEAVEAAIAAGDEPLKNAILAARHDRRVRLASKVEEMINEENEKNEKLAQRRAYRESLVARVASAEKAARTAASNTREVVAQNKQGFVKATELSSEGKRAFAQKALAEGFPIEYVEAMIGENSVENDNTAEIREVMSSDLNKTVKMAAVKSMVREATLSDADYSRLIDYWANELGYGDRDWIESLFTKKYDKKS